MRRIALSAAAAFTGVLSLAVFPPGLRAQSDNVFSPEYAQTSVTVNAGASGEFDVVDSGKGGLIILRKNRGIRRLYRSAAIILADILLLVLIWRLPKKKESDFAVAYSLSGASFVLAFWTVLFSFLLYYWKIIPAAAVFLAGAGLFWACWRSLKALRAVDIASSGGHGIAEAVRGEPVVPTDKRLSMVSGAPGEWPEADFLNK